MRDLTEDVCPFFAKGYLDFKEGQSECPFKWPRWWPFFGRVEVVYANIQWHNGYSFAAGGGCLPESVHDGVAA
jgi:hypothetical protein